MAKIDKIFDLLKYDETKINDGIMFAQWAEWEGEIVTLSREDTRWVYKQLRKLQIVENEFNKIAKMIDDINGVVR